MTYVPTPAGSFKGAQLPARTPLHGRCVTLTPLEAAHLAPLYTCLDLAHFQTSPIWRYVPFGAVDSYADWVRLATGMMDARPNCYYTILLNHEKPVGLAALLEVQPHLGNAEVGALLFSPAMQRTTASTETVYLLLKCAFEQLGNRRVAWKCHNENEPSKQAAARYGFTQEGVWRNHYVVHGKNRDSAWFSIIDTEWLDRKRVLEAWLSLENFDAQGKQKKRLQDFH